MIEDNRRYAELEVEEGVYIPDMGIDYPEDDPYQRLYHPEYIYNTVIDEHYPYQEEVFKYEWLHKLLLWFFLKVVVATMLRVKMGLRIKGRERLKKYKKELASGAITVANHMYRLDCPCALIAVDVKSKLRIPMYAPNFNTKDRFFLKLAGGVPIPPAEAGLVAMKRFNEAFDAFHKKGYWFHIFPEEARWDFYKPLRPFRKGAFTMSYKYSMPIIPCAITYRPRTGIYCLFGPKNLPLLQVEVGEPILPNTSEPRKVEVERLRKMTHLSMEKMMGIKKNSWPIEG